MCATNRKSWTVRWTRKGEIERSVDEFTARFPGTSYPAHGEWLRRTLARFARKVLEEHCRKEIAASTETLTLRARVATLEGRLRVLANHGCPPGLYSTDGCRNEGCAKCWREWGLG